MTGSEIKRLMDVVYAQWPEQRSERNIKNLATLWQAALSDVPFELAKRAVVKVMCTSKWFPKVSEIREAALDLAQGQAISWGEAWDMARHNRFLKKGMPPAVAATIEAIGYWQLTNTTNPEAMRAQWRDIYQDMATQRRERDLLPPKMRESLQLANAKARQDQLALKEGTE